MGLRLMLALTIDMCSTYVTLLLIVQRDEAKAFFIRVVNQDKLGEISWREIRGNSFFNTPPHLDITQSNSLGTMWI